MPDNQKTKLSYCTRCMTPSTHPIVQIDENGICTSCKQFEQRHNVDWTARRERFVNLVDSAKKRQCEYDCLIPVSGGKDSFWQTVTCLERGLKPLTVTWLSPAQTDVGRKNLESLIALGVDNVSYRINPDVERRFLRLAYVRLGAIGIPKHMALRSITLRAAIQYRIPTIIWGENPAVEYGRERENDEGSTFDERWVKNFGGTSGTVVEDWVGEELDIDDLAFYRAPTVDDLRKNEIRFLFLGDYFSWDPQESFEIAKRFGFQESDREDKCGYYRFADVECDFIDIHHFLKWHKYGYTRIFDDLSIEIRNGRLSREEAIAVLEQRGPGFPMRQIGRFCEFTGLSREEFDRIAAGFRNRKIWSRSNNRWVIEGFLTPDWRHWEPCTEADGERAPVSEMDA